MNITFQRWGRKNIDASCNCSGGKRCNRSTDTAKNSLKTAADSNPKRSCGFALFASGYCNQYVGIIKKRQLNKADSYHPGLEMREHARTKWQISLIFISPSCRSKLKAAFPVPSRASEQSEVMFASTCLHLLTNTSNILGTTSWPSVRSIRMWWTPCTCLSLQPCFWQLPPFFHQTKTSKTDMWSFLFVFTLKYKSKLNPLTHAFNIFVFAKRKVK